MASLWRHAGRDTAPLLTRKESGGNDLVEHDSGGSSPSLPPACGDSSRLNKGKPGLLLWVSAVCLSAGAISVCFGGTGTSPTSAPAVAEGGGEAASSRGLASVVPAPRVRGEKRLDAGAEAVSDGGAGSSKPRGRRRKLLGDGTPAPEPSTEASADIASGGEGFDGGEGGAGREGEGHLDDSSGYIAEDDFEAASKDDGDDGGVCAPLEVVGLDSCPELNSDGGAVLERMLAAKADMLRQVVQVLTDPASPGQGGNPDEPLLLVQKLAVDETDAVFGAFERPYLGHTADAAAWSPLPGGFNRWVERYHREVLKGSRPVLVTVHGDDVCALEKEISLEARRQSLSASSSGVEDVIERPSDLAAAGTGWHGGMKGNASSYSDDHGSSEKFSTTPHLHFGGDERDEGSGETETENFDIPLVLMTLGWDPAGDPTHSENLRGRDRTCTYRVLEMERVVRWFTSHTRYDTHTHEKFCYLPIGFGGHDTRNGLPQKVYLDAAKRQLEILETCPVGSAGSYDLLFQGCTLERDPRTQIWNEMTEGKEVGSPIPVNRAPLEPANMVAATTKGIFAVSPPGTGPDCFRHYEMILGGNIPLVPDVYSLRRFMEGLPAFFFGGHESRWGTLTCDQLVEMAETVQTKIQEGKENRGEGLQLEKLTHGFWRRFVRREVLRAGGLSDADAEYVERAALPLNPQGWTTFRQVGCFSDAKYLHRIDAEHRPAIPPPADEPSHGNKDDRGRKYHRLRRLESQQQQNTQQQQQQQRHQQPASDGRRRALRGFAKSGRVRLDGPNRTPSACAAHCATEIGGGVGFFGIGSGNRCWCDRVPGHFLPMEKCNIHCDGEGSGGRCGGRHASAVYAYGPETRGAPFEYLGCFPAKPYVMYHKTIRLGKTTTPFMCEAFCTSLRLPFFAVERSEYCRCGVLPANSPQSYYPPAYIKGGGYEPVPGPPNATLAAKPVPAGVKVGDSRFECHRGRCGASSNMWGCGSEKAYDLYRNTDPCVLYRDCR
ncbi:unnamed protein product [Scytosiphon promiscuus]